MTRWEYLVMPIEIMPAKSGALQDWLDDHGKNGWELVSIGLGPAIFKRPIPAEA